MLDDLKLLLGFSDDDAERDERLNWIIESVRARLRNLLGGMEPPEELRHIITEVSVVRFNRIGSEGASSHTVEGESLSFNDNDFDGFMDEINAFLDQQESVNKGRVRFL